MREVIWMGWDKDLSPALACATAADLSSPEDEVAFGEAVDLVGPNRDFDPAPGQVNVRMMTLLFGEFADLVGKGERLKKIFEREFLLQMMPVDDLPAIAKLLQQVGQRL